MSDPDCANRLADALVRERELAASHAKLLEAAKTLSYEANRVVRANSTLTMAGHSVKVGFQKLDQAQRAASALIACVPSVSTYTETGEPVPTAEERAAKANELAESLRKPGETGKVVTNVPGTPFYDPILCPHGFSCSAMCGCAPCPDCKGQPEQRPSEAMVNGRRPCPGCGETANQRMRIKHKSDCTVMANPPRTNEAQVAHQKLEVAHQKLETARRRQALSDAAIHRSLRRISERMGLAKMYDHDPVGFVGVLESEVNNDKERIVGGCKAENEAARSGDSEVIGDEDREEQHDAHVLEDDDVCDGRLGSGSGPPSKAEGESKQDLVVEAGTGGRFGCCGAEPAYIRGRPVPHSHPQRSDKAKSEPEPIPMYLTCPRCSARHIDEREFIKKPHHTHSCQACGLTWRPAVVPTVGVLWLPGFKNEWSIDHFFPTLEYKGETVHVKDPESLAAMHRLIEKVRNDTRTQFEPRETDACEPRPETPIPEGEKR